MVKFCHCGRVENSPRCLKDKHSEKSKEPKKKMPRYSGESKFREEEGSFQGRNR